MLAKIGCWIWLLTLTSNFMRVEPNYFAEGTVKHDDFIV